MNIIHASRSVLTSATPSTDRRFQIYRESRGGNFVLGFSADSDAEIIEAFMFQAPAYDGGDIRVLDQSEQRMVAFLKWKIATSDSACRSFIERIFFRDWHYAMIACGLLKQRKIQDAVETPF
jgi:hypothetical protein